MTAHVFPGRFRAGALLCAGSIAWLAACGRGGEEPHAAMDHHEGGSSSYFTSALNPRPGQPGHEDHVEWEGAFPTPESRNDFRVVRTFPLPDGFLGNMAVDPESGRMWLISLGPPTNTEGPSTLYEVDPATGAVLRQAELPFLGDFGTPVFIDGYLYQGIFHQSMLYKVAVNDPEPFGAVVAEVRLPTLNDLKLVDEAHPYPFIEFGGVTATPDGHILIHADDVGEFIKIHKETGEILNRARTIKAMGGITGTMHDGRFLVVGNSDPRGGYCALAYPPALSRSPEQRDISWALSDGYSGEVLASVRMQNSRAYASSVALARHELADGFPYGKFAFYAMGEEGMLEIEWSPGRNAY
jgi:hypothetical protein